MEEKECTEDVLEALREKDGGGGDVRAGRVAVGGSVGGRVNNTGGMGPSVAESEDVDAGLDHEDDQDEAANVVLRARHVGTNHNGLFILGTTD